MQNNDKMQVKVNIENTEQLKCGCGGALFAKAVEVRKVPALLAGTSKDVMLFVEYGAICADCGRVLSLKELNDAERRDEDNVSDLQ